MWTYFGKSAPACKVHYVFSWLLIVEKSNKSSIPRIEVESLCACIKLGTDSRKKVHKCLRRMPLANASRMCFAPLAEIMLRKDKGRIECCGATNMFGVFWMWPKNELSTFQIPTRMIILSQERGWFSKVIFKIEVQNKEALNGNGFSTQTPKMWHKCGINWKEKPVRSSKWTTYGNFKWR